MIIQVEEPYRFIFSGREVRINKHVLNFLHDMYRTNHPYGTAENALRRLTELESEFRIRYGISWSRETITKDDHDRLVVVCALSLLVGIPSIGSQH